MIVRKSEANFGASNHFKSQHYETWKTPLVNTESAPRRVDSLPRDGIAARAQTVVRHTANAGADFARTPGQLRHEGYIASGDKKPKVDSFARINFFL